MQITFTSPYQVTCDCGWYVTTITQMSESQAQEIGREHILNAHTAQDGIVLGEGVQLLQLPKLEEVEVNLSDDVYIRTEALRAATSNRTETYAPKVAIGWAKQYEHYIRTGESPASQ
jgi:signal transduction protein with GAF and PtsI domain